MGGAGTYLSDMLESIRSTGPTVIAIASALLGGKDIEVFEMEVHMSARDGRIGILPRRRGRVVAGRVLRDDDLPVQPWR